MNPLVFLVAVSLELTLYTNNAAESRCPTLSVAYGKIHADIEVDCDLTLNSLTDIDQEKRTLHYRGKESPGYIYGLITYNCTECSNCPVCIGSLVSRFTGCIQCTICEHNELIPKCRSIVLPIIASVVMTMIIISILYIIHRFLSRYIWYNITLIYPIIYCKSALTHNKNKKKVKKDAHIINLVKSHNTSSNMNDPI